jgi:hypothetical protein
MMTGAIPDWWGWGYWVSPLSYGFNAIAVNEMSAPRWMNKNVRYHAQNNSICSINLFILSIKYIY